MSSRILPYNNLWASCLSAQGPILVDLLILWTFVAAWARHQLRLVTKLEGFVHAFCATSITWDTIRWAFRRILLSSNFNFLMACWVAWSSFLVVTNRRFRACCLHSHCSLGFGNVRCLLRFLRTLSRDCISLDTGALGGLATDCLLICDWAILLLLDTLTGSFGIACLPACLSVLLRLLQHWVLVCLLRTVLALAWRFCAPTLIDCCLGLSSLLGLGLRLIKYYARSRLLLLLGSLTFYFERLGCLRSWNSTDLHLVAGGDLPLNLTERAIVVDSETELGRPTGRWLFLFINYVHRLIWIGKIHFVLTWDRVRRLHIELHSLLILLLRVLSSKIFLAVSCRWGGHWSL